MRDRSTASTPCVDANVPQLVARYAFTTPDRIALSTESTEISYQRLDAMTDRLALRLLASGLKREQAVGVFLGRSVEFVVAVLAVLKAGGCYVPLDPDYPPARLQMMLETATVDRVVTRPDLAGRLPAGSHAVETLDLAELEAGAEAGGPVVLPAFPSHPYDLAYIMFTSGSTGRPKAVGVRHCGITRLVAQPNYVDLGSGEVMANISSPSFDASTFEIWGALANGGRLAIGPTAMSATELGRFFRDQQVTCTFLTAGLFNLMVDERLDDLAGLRQLLTGGDIMAPSHARRFLAAHPHCRLVNAYGPTEVTTFTTYHEVTSADLCAAGGRVPIGRPISGTFIEIFDDEMRPVPPGVPGQLYAGGPGMARGYLGDPALTAERFVPDPWGRGERLYATGDTAVFNDDGSIDFLGRTDQQIKKRGFRVEPVEIEESLRLEPPVRDAAVVLSGATTHEAVLVAYLVPEASAGSLDLPAIRAAVSERLPAYLVPDRFVTVAALPLNPNGKIDRRALTERAETERAGGSADIPANDRTETEAKLAAIWCEVLDLPVVGVHDDFFDLGGQSLQASRMSSRLRTAFGVELALSAIFDQPTVAELATLIDQGGHGD